MKLKPRYYQRDSVDNFFSYVEENHGKHPIIVLPTASGKSLVQAMIVEKMLEWDNTRILLITHQKELIKQNYTELMENTSNMFLDIGIHSAGLNLRDTRNRILFVGIQSVYKKAWDLGFFDLILVDECHLINHNNVGMYRSFLDEMVKINPKIVIGGLSATPYRLKGGILTEGEDKLFDDFCHEVTVKELIDPIDYRNKDKKQYLCELVSKNGVNKVDLSDVHIRGGEYVPGEMEKAFQKGDLVSFAVKDMIEYTQDRKKVLTFTAGINHCEEVTEKINSLGFEARSVHSQKNKEINDKNINDFKVGAYKYLVNVDVMTTGFNEKAIDCVTILRSTMSPGLYYQIVGRGLRQHPSKSNCLILDFGQNIERHGPIDKIEIRKKKDGTGNEVVTCPQKECPRCQALLALAVSICPNCQFQFPQSNKHEEKASEQDILSKWKKPELYEVTNIHYERHSKIGKPDSLRVDYYCGLEKFSEWVCIEHSGFAQTKALQWLARRTTEGLHIRTVDEALEWSRVFKIPKKIIVNENNSFPQIIGYEFPQEKEEELNNKDFVLAGNFDTTDITETEEDDIPF